MPRADTSAQSRTRIFAVRHDLLAGDTVKAVAQKHGLGTNTVYSIAYKHLGLNLRYITDAEWRRVIEARG